MKSPSKEVSLLNQIILFKTHINNNFMFASLFQFQQVYNQFYSAILPEVTHFLTWVCRSHDLPLALTWAPCARQGKGGSRHSDENFSECVSTIDSACFVLDENSNHFLEACSEHHLLQGEGIVGKAFKATKLFFVPEVTTFSKTNYPLAHHANISGLHAALAVPLKTNSMLRLSLFWSFSSLNLALTPRRNKRCSSHCL